MAKIKQPEIVEFQTFLGGEKQEYRTTINYRGREIIVHRKKPLPFIIDGSGKIIPDIKMPNTRNHYHPS